MDLGIKLDPSTVFVENKMKTGANKGEQVEKTAEQFESFLIFSMLKEVGRATNITKKGYAEQMQMSVFYEKVADSLARKGIGIKDMIAKYAGRGSKVSDVNGEKSS